MSWWKMSAPDHAFMPTFKKCMARDRHVQPEHRCLTKKGLLANSKHYFATANVLIYVIRLNPCFQKPAYISFSMKQVAGKASLLTIT